MRTFFKIIFFLYSAIAFLLLSFVYSQDGSPYGDYARFLGVMLVGLPWSAGILSFARSSHISDVAALILGWAGIVVNLGILGGLSFRFTAGPTEIGETATLIRQNSLAKRENDQFASLRNQLTAARLCDACKIAEHLGFSRHGGTGSHRTYGRADEPRLLHFQDRNGYIMPYQARQLLEMVEKYATLSD
jgi:hypothetical protein